MSAAKTDEAPSAVIGTLVAVQVEPVHPLFSYHVVLSLKEADITSKSPSPSISAAKTSLALVESVVI